MKEESKMSNILEKLFYGEINPSAQGIRPDSTRYRKALETLCEREEELLGLLEGPAKEAFGQYCAAREELRAISDLEFFAQGYRLGVKLLLAAQEPDT